ncbi:MAG: DinB superfamily protein [Flammeovirgaceae bacterium]|nr:DinB superfamily protein [Flammeovirgaceae bacterium]|tara:strand:- start:1337 stop:1783 length:447 start_codon:yes stop_codon:yes gene_type:complete
MKEDLRKLFLRDLEKLEKEINAYRNEHSIWHTDLEISNSAGNLCKHLTGNLRHFIGNILGSSDYVRDREAEFSTPHLSKAALNLEIASTKEAINLTFNQLHTNKMQQIYPIEVFGHKMTVQYFLLHLLSHLNYHLGQVNYHRRLLDRV